MKFNLKLPKETWVFFIICAIGIYFIFVWWVKPIRIGRMITYVNVTYNPSEKDMEKIKESNTPHAIKEQENSEYYLYVYGIYMNGERVIGKYSLTKEQYDSIDSRNLYWLDIKYKKKNDFTQGTVKKVYDYNPMQR